MTLRGGCCQSPIIKLKIDDIKTGYSSSSVEKNLSKDSSRQARTVIRVLDYPLALSLGREVWTAPALFFERSKAKSRRVDSILDRFRIFISRIGRMVLDRLLVLSLSKDSNDKEVLDRLER